MEQNKCNKCGRPMQYATEPKCNYCNSCMREYCGCKLGRIKEIEPTCDSTAVIPSITVESVEGITNLANCLVHVEDTNTTYYVDDKHRVMITWAGPVDIPGYDMENNPNHYKDQIVTDVENGIAVIYDKHGKGYLFGTTPDSLQEAVNNKLDEMVEDGTMQELVDAYFPKKVDYYRITSESTSADIISAFAVENAKVIEFDSGTYELSNDLILTSNTIVYMNGASLTRSGSQWCLGYDRDSEYTGYNGIHNVEINNGNIQLPIALMHNADITFTNVTFLPVNDHAIQMAGCKDVILDSCVFEGRIINDGISDHFEAIQLESATRGGQPFLNDDDSPSYDHKGNTNIVIKNCEFKSGDGISTKMYTGIGHHSDDANNHYPNDFVTIEKCVFHDAWYAQMTPCGFKNSTISGCIFKYDNNLGAVQNIRFRYLNENITIKDNIFIGGRNNITNVNATGYCIGLKIVGNSFDSNWTDNLCNVIIGNWKKVEILNNAFNAAKSYSVYIGANDSYPAEDVVLEGNSFKVDNLTSTGENIYLRYCSKTGIYGNTFEKGAVAVSGKYSILATNDATYVSYANNNIKGIEGVFMTGVTDYTNIYDTPDLIYIVDDASYSALSNVSPTHAFTQFEKLILIIHKNEDPSNMMSIPLSAYSVSKKLSLGKSYNLQLTDGTNTGIVTFTINNDGTFSYTSADSFTLRRIYALN